jgi:cation-transporting ATPase 13A3/4/5
MACCQSLAVHEGELIGDPLEQQTFEAAGATLQDTGDLQGFQQLIRVQLSPEQTISMGVKEQFEFSSALQRMSVLCKDLDTGVSWAFVKGSPEMMETLCVASSIPADYKSVLAHFAHQGYRVIAIGRKTVPSDLPLMDKPDLRLLVEKELQFLGLVLLENKVKEESEPTLQILRKAAIRCCMITGDSQTTHTCAQQAERPTLWVHLLTLSLVFFCLCVQIL